MLSLLAFVGIFILCTDDLIDRMGNQTVWCEALFLCTVFSAIAVLFSAIAWWRAPKESVGRGVRAYSRIVTIALLISAFYLAYWDVIGPKTWT